MYYQIREKMNTKLYPNRFLDALAIEVMIKPNEPVNFTKDTITYKKWENFQAPFIGVWKIEYNSFIKDEVQGVGGWADLSTVTMRQFIDQCALLTPDRKEPIIKLEFNPEYDKYILS